MNETVKKGISKVTDVILVDSDVKLYLTLTANPAKKYAVAEFDLTFSQAVDHKDQPQNDTNGGVIEFSLTELPDDILTKWMLNSTMMLSGLFSFERSMQSSVMKISFEDSYCVSYHKSIGVGGTVTRMRISPELVNINGKEKLKIWAR